MWKSLIFSVYNLKIIKSFTQPIICMLINLIILELIYSLFVLYPQFLGITFVYYRSF